MIVLSARSDLQTKLLGFDLGAVDYVAKPFSLDELLARARVQLRRTRGGDDRTLITVGHLELDLACRQARVGGIVADLSDREFRVLHFLALHVGEVVSRERLLSEVWGYDFDPRSNVVDVCVRRLRRRLGPELADRDRAQCGVSRRRVSGGASCAATTWSCGGWASPRRTTRR